MQATPTRGETLRPVAVGAVLAGVAAGLGQPGVLAGVDDGEPTRAGLLALAVVGTAAAVAWGRAAPRGRGAQLAAAPAAALLAVAVVLRSPLAALGGLGLACLAPAFAALTDATRPRARRLAALGASVGIASGTVLGGYAIAFIISVLLRLDEADGILHGAVYGLAVGVALLFVAGSVAITTHLSLSAETEDDVRARRELDAAGTRPD